MLEEKQYIKRSVRDRRSYVDRRILNFGTQDSGKEQRIKEDRRQGWEDRVGWQTASLGNLSSPGRSLGLDHNIGHLLLVG